MNILLIGMPGSGKTKVGKLLAKRLNREFIDVDEWIYAQTGKDSAKHLEELGDEEFLKFEAQLAKKIDVKDAIIASSGSIPLNEEGINHLKQNAFVVWIKPSLAILEKRVGRRNDGDTRIVGRKTKTMQEIWEWREKEYHKHHHAILEIKEEIEKEEVVERLVKLLEKEKII